MGNGQTQNFMNKPDSRETQKSSRAIRQGSKHRNSNDRIQSLVGRTSHRLKASAQEGIAW